MKQNQMGDLLRQVTRMRKDMDKVHEDLRNRFVESSVGEGRVTVTCNGQQEVVKIAIAGDKLDRREDGGIDLEILEDMLLAAVNQSLKKSKDLMNKELSDVTGGLSESMPGLF